MVVDNTPAVEDAAKAVTQCLRVLTDLARLYGFTGEIESSKTEQHWLTLVKETGGKWMKVVKYKLNAFYAYHRNQPLPKAPFGAASDLPGVLFGGRLGRFFTLYLARKSRQETSSLLTSILQSKKGMQRASKTDLKQAERDLIHDLTQEPERRRVENLGGVWHDFDSYDEAVELTLSEVSFKGQIRRMVRELFHGEKYEVADRVKAFFPSTSANYISSRKNAGAVGEILRHPRLLKGIRKAGGQIAPKTRKSEEIENEEDGVMAESNFTEFDLAFRVLWERMMELTKQELNIAEPVALPEALKNRVITKGPAFTQTVLRGVQKKTWATLFKHPAFYLIGGGEVTGKYMLERLGRQLKETEGYLSGDYEGATNNIKRWASETAAEAIGDELNIQGYELQLYIANLTRHWLEDEEGNLVLQRTGQLMGSITSFPILCILNAVVCRWAYELDTKRKTPLREWPGMINGDDCCMRCTKKGVEAWRLLAGFIGLKESVGKTYYSTKFVNINSTNFEVGQQWDEQEDFLDYDEKDNPVIRHTPYVRTKFINMGLMNGLKRSGLSIGLSDQDDPRDNIGVRYRELMRSCPSSMRGEVHKGFIDKHRDLLSKTYLPWYMPEWIGGLGLLGYEMPSELDLRVARMILLNWKKTRPISLAHGDTNWKIWQLAEKRVPKPYFVEKKNEGVELYNAIVVKQCIDLLFDSSITLDTLFEEVTKGQKVSTAIRHNAKLWDPRRYGNHLPAPMKYDDILFKPKYSSYKAANEPNPLIDLD